MERRSRDRPFGAGMHMQELVLDTFVTVPSRDVKPFLKAFALVGWDALALGGRVTTEEGLDAETVVRVRIDAARLARSRGLDSPLLA